MTRLFIPITLVLTVGCTANEGDARDDSFGGKDIKADGSYSSCQLAEVLKLVNESTSTTGALSGFGLSDDAARSIVAHRNGADDDPGTADDDIYDDLDELDAVDFVGNLALGKLVYSIIPRCEVDLATRPFIDDQTFVGQSGGWARDNAEVESVLGVQGITGQRLRALLLTKNSDGRTLYERMRKNELMQAFTYNFALDEIPWDSDSQAAREQMPLVALTIEPDRFAPNTDGVRELSLGTDLMDDTYFDTHAYSLLGNEIELRNRARWDDPTTVRRLLIAAKFGTEIDAEGNKVNTKVDIRNDSGTAFLPKLDDDVRRGKTAWSGTDTPITPIRGVYEQLGMKNVLLEVGAHKGVLLLEAQAHLRSTRSRYHMNEANISNVRLIYANATSRIQAALNTVTRARSAGIIPTADATRVNAMEAMGKAILDKSLLVSRINAADSSLNVTVSNLQLPDGFTAPTTAAQLDKNRVISEVVNTVLHEYATALDDTDRAITDSADEDFDDFVEMFRAWRISLDNTMARKTTYDSFLASHRSLSTAANRANAIAAFNAYGAAQKAANDDTFDNFAALDDTSWDHLGNHIEKMTLTIGERQIETAGLAGRMLWFDQARAFWVPASNRAFSNFMIDTFDMTDMMSNEEWGSIAEADRTFAKPLPATKVFNTTLVNELQVELGMEAAYVARLKELDAAVAADPTNTTLAQQLEGARFVWGQYTGAMKVLSAIKGDNVLSRLKKAGAPAGITWAAPADSKGNIALKILADRD